MPKVKEKELKTPNISRFSAPFEVSYQYLFFLLRMYLYNTRNQFVGNTGTWVRIPPRPPITRFLLRAKTLFFYEFPQKVPSKSSLTGTLQGLRLLIMWTTTIPSMLHQDASMYSLSLKNHYDQAILEYLSELFRRACPCSREAMHKYAPMV